MHKATILVAHEVACAARNSTLISASALEYTVNRTEEEAKQRRVEIEAALPRAVARRLNPAHYPIKPRCPDVKESLEHFVGQVARETLDVPTRKQPSRLAPEEAPSMPEESPIDAH
jgi:hypothetical protein